jgi:hypothetical protein
VRRWAVDDRGLVGGGRRNTNGGLKGRGVGIDEQWS